MKTRRSLIGAALLWIAAAAAAAQDFDAVEIKTTALTDGVYMLVGAGGNLGLSAGHDGVFLIDDQFAPLTDKIRAAVAAIDDGPIRFVINTHWHYDHTGGNEKLGQAGALIVAHDNVRKRMSAEQFIEALDQHVPPSPHMALPVVTFDDGVTFYLNDDEIHVFHVPRAHTDGDAVIHFRKADVIHAGDVFFSGGFPFIDVSSGGSIDGTIAAVDLVLKHVGVGTKIIPGHGPLSFRKDLVAYRDMLAAVRARIAPLVRAGKTLEQVRQERPTEEFDDGWGGGFIDSEKFISIVYDSLSSGS